MNQLRLTRLAEGDIADIHAYIARDSVSAADKQIDSFFSKFERLCEFPHLGEPRPEFGGGDLSVLGAGSYVIFYRCRKEVLEVVRVAHGARDFEMLFP